MPPFSAPQFEELTMNESDSSPPNTSVFRVTALAAMLIGIGMFGAASAQQVLIVNANAVAAKPAAAAAENADDKPLDDPTPNADVAKPAEKDADAKRASDRPNNQRDEKPQPNADRPAMPTKAAPKPRANMDVVWNAVPAINNQIAIERQARTRLEPMLKTELSFANRAAGLNDDERRALVVASKKWFDDFVVDFVKNLDPNQRQMWLQGMRAIGGQVADEDPRVSIQHGVAELVAATLPEEKVVAYETEAGKRSAFFRNVIVQNLVDMIDAKVVLSPDQRQKISASLNSHWDPSWVPQLEMFALGNDMWPNVPDQWILPELTPLQRGVLSALNRPSGQIFVGNAVFGAEIGEIDDIDLNDVPPQTDDAKKD
jgi:hypothetical protein